MIRNFRMFVFNKFCLRRASTSGILLPQTNFPLRIKPHARRERDDWIAREANFKDLYTWQEASTFPNSFILHDGPPYANGKPHMGHVLNKLLKDFTLRYHMLCGKKVHYKPGWDCHGLPIELKAQLGGNLTSPLNIREQAKKTALNAIKEQKNVFTRLGILANWTHSYLTMSPDYIVQQLEIFSCLYEEGLIFRELKPVYWSPSSRTALAESELDYKEDHISKAIYLKLNLLKPYPDFIGHLPPNSLVFLVIWTTTPWTLPANQTVCYDPSSSYSLVQIGNECDGQYFIIAASQLKRLEKVWSKELIVIKEFNGSALEGSVYKHPLEERALPVLSGRHVSDTKGTGFVHTAPAHGPEDFLVALEHKLPIISLVDESGTYNEESISELTGLNVLQEGQEKVLELIKNNIVHCENFVHSYPYDWRTKKPVILRASLQWFINTQALKDAALNAMSTVKVVPSSLSKVMVNYIKKRPYWCISRQRSWGVPIPVFYDPSGNVVFHRDIVRNLRELVLRKGPDVWWTHSPQEIVGEEQLKKLGVKSNYLTKGSDIIDIWFDSGVSWSCVLPEPKKADICIEGIDQFGGWFQSSLLTSVACRKEAPFKKLFAHGFVLDQNGQKMSKSLGNYIDPQLVLDGHAELPAVGIDALRWWAATHITKNGTGIPVSRGILLTASDEVQKIRSVFRFLLGNLHGTASEMLSEQNLLEMRPTDAYILHLLSDYSFKCLDAYEDMNFKKVANLSLNFITNHVSAFYLSVIKDRLYCHSRNSKARLQAVYALNEILEQVTLILAPILPHLCEEVEAYHPWNSGKMGLFRNRRYALVKDHRNKEISEIMQSAVEIRDALNKEIGSSNIKEFVVKISISDINTFNHLQKLQDVESSQNSALCELLQVSKVQLRYDPAEVFSEHRFRIECLKTAASQCKRCRRFVATSGVICQFCVNRLRSQ